MRFNWGIIGCGHIANEMAQAMKDIGGNFYGVYSRTHENAVKFASEYGIEKVYISADDMVDDNDIDIVYIATPHNSHIEYIKKALNAGKHVLCEKAITLNSAELEEAVSLADEKGLVLAEAMTIFHCPVYTALDDIIASGRLGVMKALQVNLGSYKDYDMTNRFFNMSLAGGAMLDIGVYALSFARYFMTQRPDNVLSQMKKAPSGVDEQVNIILNNSKNEMAAVTISLSSKLPKLGLVAFENGYVTVENYNRTNKLSITYTEDGHTEIIEKDNSINALGYELIDMEKAVALDKNNMHLDYTVDVMDIMTKVRYEHGMLYNEETGEYK